MDADADADAALLTRMLGHMQRYGAALRLLLGHD